MMSSTHNARPVIGFAGAMLVALLGILGLVGSAHALVSYQVLHSFTGTDGGYPYVGQLLQGSDGNFYGTTTGGGASSFGTVFQMDGTTHAVTTLYSFTRTGTDGGYPFAGLLQGTDGNFYGTTSEGGASNNGTVFVLQSASPTQAIQDLITTITTMGLAAGEVRSLTAPLGQVSALLNDNNPNNDIAACGKLNAFINQVNAKARSGQLTSAQASQLLQEANAIKASLGCSP